MSVLMACILMAGVALSAHANTRYVTPTGSDTGDCIGIGNPCATVQYTVNQSDDGDVIRIDTGTYEEDVIVDVGVAIERVDANAEPVIDGGFQLSTDGVTLLGLNIINGAESFASETAGVYILGGTEGHLIEDNQITGSGPTGSRGILVGIGVSNSDILGNDISNWTSGIYVNRSSNANILIDGNTISDNVAGIGGDNYSDVTISNNDFVNNSVEAIGYFYDGTAGTASGPNIIDNSFVDNDAYVQIYGDADLDAEQFIADNNVGEAVYAMVQGGVWPSIGTAIEAVTSGDTLVLATDITEGLVTLDKAITLDGNDHVLTSTSASYGVRIESSDVEVRNLTVQQAGTFGIHQAPGSNNLVISDTTVQNSGSSGFAMNCSDNILLESIQSYDNGGNGVSISNCTDVTIDGLTTSGNMFTTFNAGVGIFSNAGTCTPDITDGVVITGTINIAEDVTIYEQQITGSISNVQVPAAIGSHITGWGISSYYQGSLEDALDAAEAIITNDPAAKPLVFAREVDGDFHVADFMSIQAAIDAAGSGDGIDVTEGVYAETLAIDKPLTLRGPNDGIAGYDDASRVGEAVIEFPAGITDGSHVLVAIDSDGVTISGFTLNDNLTPGLTYDGTWPLPLSARGIMSFGSNTVVENNRFSGFNNIAVHMTQPGAAAQTQEFATEDNITRYNYLEGGAVFHAIYYQAAGGVIEYNRLVDVHGGIQVQPYRTNASGVVNDNEFSMYSSGLYYNYANGTTSPDFESEWVFSGNIVTAPSAEPVWDEQTWNATVRHFEGIRVETYIETAANGEPKADFVNNIIDADGATSSATGWPAIRGMFFRNINGDASQNVDNITFTDNTFANIEVGVQFSEITPLEFELEPLFGNGNTYPDGMVIVPPYQIAFAPVVNITQELGYNTIQGAVDDASDGDVIEISAGTYDETVLVDKSVTLLGDPSGADRPMVTWAEPLTAGEETLIRVAAQNVTIDGLELQVDQTYVGEAIRTVGDAGGLAVRNNRIVASASDPGSLIGFGIRNAIAVDTLNRSPVQNGFAVTIEDNLIEATPTGVGIGGFFRAGVAMDTSTGTISGNDVMSWNHDVIARFTLGGNLVVSGNTSRGGGIQLSEFNATGPVTVSGNDFLPDPGFITALGSSQSSLRLQNNPNAIATSVTGNTFSGHATGIRAENFPAVSIADNDFAPTDDADYRHIVVSNRVHVTNYLSPHTIDIAIDGNDFGSSSADGVALVFDNNNCCEPVGSGTTTATFADLRVGGVSPNSFDGGLTQYVVLDDTTGIIDEPPFAQTESQPFFADVDAQGNIWDGVAGADQDEAERAATRARIIDNRVNGDLGNVILEFLGASAEGTTSVQGIGAPVLPVAGVLVEAFQGGVDFDSDISDATGIYTLVDLPEGNVDIEASLAGFATSQQVVAFGEGESQVDIDFLLSSSVSASFTAAAEGQPLAGQSFFADRDVNDVDLSVARNDGGADVDFYVSLTVFDSLGNQVDYINDGLFTADTLIALDGLLGEGNNFTLGGNDSFVLLNGATLEIGPNADQLDVETLSFRLIDGRFGSSGNRIVHAVTHFDVTIGPAPSVSLQGLDSSTLTAEFSTEVVSNASGYVGMTPAQVADTAVDPASKETFLLTFFDFNPAELALIEDWGVVSVAGTDTELSVTFAPGLFDKTFALDQGNTGASRIDAAWDGTDEFETLSGQPLDGPAESAFKLEFTVPYSDTTGVDYSAPVTTTFIDAAKPIIRPFAPGIESGTTTTDPVAINYAVGSYATGLVAEYSLDSGTPVAYSSGDPLTEAGFYELTVTNDSNPNVEPGASTTIRFTIESELVISIDGPTLAPVVDKQFYEVRLQNLLSTEPSENVLGQVIVDRAAGIAVGDVVVDYCADSEAAGVPENCANWVPLNLVDDGGVLTATYGPGAGFPVEPGYDATTFFRVSFVTAGNYDVAVNALGADSDSVLASDFISIAATDLAFDIIAGVDPAVPDEDEGWAYYTATLVNLGDELPENVALWVAVDGIDDAAKVAGDLEIEYFTGTVWQRLGWAGDSSFWWDYGRDAWFLGRPEADPSGPGPHPIEGFPIGAGESFPTPIRINFDNDLYDLTVTVETADQNADPVWVYGLFEEQIEVVTSPEGSVAAEINGADADGQSLTIGDAFDLSLSASDVLPRTGKELFVVFDGQRPSDGSPQPGQGICEDLLGLTDCALLADFIGFDHPVDAGDSTLFDGEVSIRPDAETGTWTLNFFLVEALDDGAGGSTPGHVVDTLSVELTIDEATLALDGLGTDTLTVQFSTDVLASGGSYDGLSPADIAAQATDTTGKQAFLDEFFQIWISVGGVPTPVDAADLDAFGTDWDKVLVDGTSDSLSVTFEAGIIELDFSLDQGNTGATRIDVEWIGTSAFVTESGAQPLDGPDAADNPFKVEFDVDYSLATGPDYGPATATFIDRTTLLQRPFVTGIEFGGVARAPVAVEFAADVSATVSLDGGAEVPYSSGEELTTAGDYRIVATNDANPNIEPGAQTALEFTIVEPAGTLAVTADGAPLDGESIVRGDSRLLNISVDDVEAPLGAELAVVFDGFAPGDTSPVDGNVICDQLLESADCTALDAVISLGNTFTDDIELFNDTVTVLETADSGEWTLRFFLVEVDGGSIVNTVSQLDATIEVLERDTLSVDLDGLLSSYVQGDAQAGGEQAQFVYSDPDSAATIEQIFNVFVVLDDQGNPIPGPLYDDLFVSFESDPLNYIRGLSGTTEDNVVSPQTINVDLLFEFEPDAPVGTYTLVLTSYDVTGIDPADVSLSAALAGDYPVLASDSSDPISIEAIADISVTIEDNRDTIEVGERNTYVLVISNAGPSSVTGATAQGSLPPELDAATADWNCFPSLGATCSADGVGEINDTVDLPANSSLVYILEADVLMGPTQTIVVEASVQLPADVDPSDPAGLSDSVTTQVIITEDGIFQDRFEDEADTESIDGHQVQGILELPAQSRQLHPVQPLVIGRDAAGRPVFRAVLAGAGDQQWVRLSMRDSLGGWTHSTWQELANDDRVLAFEFDAELGIYILVGEDLTLELPLSRTATHPVSSIDTADRVDLILNQ